MAKRPLDMFAEEAKARQREELFYRYSTDPNFKSYLDKKWREQFGVDFGQTPGQTEQRHETVEDEDHDDHDDVKVTEEEDEHGFTVKADDYEDEF